MLLKQITFTKIYYGYFKVTRHRTISSQSKKNIQHKTQALSINNSILTYIKKHQPNKKQTNCYEMRTTKQYDTIFHIPSKPWVTAFFLGLSRTVFIAVFSLVAIIGCSDTRKKFDHDTISTAAMSINALFLHAAEVTNAVATQAKNIYEKPLQKDVGWNQNYVYFDKSVYYKPHDDGLCAMWASGKTPIGRQERQRIASLETLQPTLVQAVTENQFIQQAYILTKDHIAFYYPFISGVSLFEPKTDFYTAFFPFSVVTPANNPERTGRWIEPYIDATGKGYVVSYSHPVYVNDTFEAAVGIDIVLRAIEETCLPQDIPLILLSSQSIPVAVTPALHAMTGLEGLGPLYYFGKVQKDNPVSSTHRLVLKPDLQLRTLGRKIMEGQSEFYQMIGKKKFYIVTALIPAVDWYVVGVWPIS
ncbi:cache domain-containing protein [Desulfovibrio inopinatus]|uniref:cache domain-containing protein n=1 Tax=Desulfovibrio inopinatus TaxID=102109 RepID=UPI0003FB3127|nr:cache domain-containing protein [Desulfovibrio inopinatus]